MQIIAISNQKGGCGKTSSATNLTAAMSRLGYKCLLVDLDPQAHATFALGFRNDFPKGTMYNVMTEQPDKKNSFIENVILPVDACFDLAPSHILLSTIEQEFTDKDESICKLQEVLSSISYPYDFIIIDCPPSLGFLTFNALRAASVIMVPLDLGSFSLMGVGKLLSMVELLKVKLRHVPKVFAFANMTDMRSNFAKKMLSQIRDSFGAGILTGSIRQSIAVREAQAKGVNLFAHNSKTAAANDYMLLAQEVVAKVSEQRAASAAMLEKKESSDENCLKEFILKTIDAREVHVVGDFNGWRISENSLLWQKERGVWQKRFFLEPGRYRYKFIIDGKWVNDPQNQTLEPNPYGGLDSVVDVA